MTLFLTKCEPRTLQVRAEATWIMRSFVPGNIVNILMCKDWVTRNYNNIKLRVKTSWMGCFHVFIVPPLSTLAYRTGVEEIASVGRLFYRNECLIHLANMYNIILTTKSISRFVACSAVSNLSLIP